MNYPEWIDEYAKAIHQAFSGMVPSHWSSVNGFEIMSVYQGAFLNRIYDLLQAHKNKGTSNAELWNAYSSPSSLRSSVWKLIDEYRAIENKEAHKEKARFVFDALDQVLASGMREDKWVFEKNIAHSPEMIQDILSSTPWIKDDLAATKHAAQLYVAAASNAFALYRDFFPEDSHEVYGPYDASTVFGPNTELIIKHFKKMRPTQLWPEVAGFPCQEIKIYQVIQNVHFRCEFIGMHSLYDGPVVPNTLAVAVALDGRFIPSEEIPIMADTIAKTVTDYSHLYDALDLESAKKRFVEWEAYTFVDWFKLVDMDWHPTAEMLAPVLAADIQAGFGVDSFPDYENFISSPDYEIYWLKDLYRSK